MMPVKLIFKIAAITAAIMILLVYGSYQLTKGSFFGSLVGLLLAGIIMYTVTFFYVGPKFKAYLESQESHEEVS